MDKVRDRATEAAPGGKPTHGPVAPAQLPGLLRNPHLPEAWRLPEVARRAPSAPSSGHIHGPLLQRRVPAQAQRAFSFPSLRHTPGSSGLRGGGPGPRAAAGDALGEEKRPAACGSATLGRLPCSALRPAPPAPPHHLPHLTTGRGRPPIKSKCNLFGPDTDLLKK